MAADLTAYVPRLLLEWEAEQPGVRYRAIDGTLVFADVSGFTALSERLAVKGKVGAEEMADTISELFTTLLAEAALWGGEMLKFGGDAVLLFFDSTGHEARAARAGWELQRRIRSAGRIDTGNGRVVLRMSIGMASGSIDLFAIGRRHRELLVLGPTTTEMVAMESAADAGEVLLSKATAAALAAGAIGDDKAGGRLLRGAPRAEQVKYGPVERTDDGSRYLAPVVHRHLSGGGIEPEHRVATVSFINFYGVDQLLAGEDRDAVAAKLDDILTRIQEILEHHGVAFLATDVAGDGAKVMAAAGAPFMTGNDEERSLRAARDIADLDGEVRVRVGVNNGRIFAASVGPPFRRTYTAMGDPTNTSARLMGKAEGGQVVTLLQVLDRSRSDFQTTELEPFLAKGKTEPLHPIAVGQVTQGGARRPAESPDVPLLGRDEELLPLVAAATEARSGRGGIVRIVGEPGMGKTRLLDELVARSPDMWCLRIAFGEYDASTPYAASAQVLRALLDVHDCDSLRVAVTRRAAHLAPMLPLLGIATRLDMPSTPEVDILDPGAVTQRLHLVVGELLTSILARPQLWCFEDAVWVDAASAALFTHLSDQFRAAPLLVCATARLKEGGWAEDDHSVMELGPISDEAARELIRKRAPRFLLANEVTDLAERADGNPLFLLRLAEASSDLTAELPDTVEGLLASRLDLLSPRDRLSLRRLAVLGTTFDARVAAAVLGEDVEFQSMGGHIEATGDGNMRFVHPLVRDVAYEGLPYRRRQEMHRAAGEEYERRFGEDVVELLSLHFAAGGDHEKALSYSKRAAARAVDRYAYLPAITFYERALDQLRHVDEPALQRAHLLQDYGDALRKCGRADEARGAYRRARRKLDPTDDRAVRLMLQQGLCSEALGDYRGAVRWYRRALRDLEGRGPSVAAAQCLLALGAARILQGRLSEAEASLERAYSTASDVGALGEAAHALQLLHAAALSSGKAGSRELGERALDAARAAGDRHRVAAVLTNLGADAYYAGAWADAEGFYTEAAARNREIGALLEAAAVEGNLGELYLEMGDLARAEEALEEAALSLRRLGSPRVALVHLTLARVAAARGDAAAAFRHLDEAESTFRRVGALARLREAQVRRAEVLFELGFAGVREALPPADEVPAPLRALADRLRGST